MCDNADQYDLLYEGGCVVGKLSGYILSVVCTAVLCGMILLLFEKRTIQGVVKLVLGIVLTVAVLKPIIQDDFISLEDHFDDLQVERMYAVATGSDYAKLLEAEIIKEKTQAYILDEAAKLGADITAEVELDTDNIPVSVCIYGQMAPYTKKQLESVIESQLAIQKENLLWK